MLCVAAIHTPRDSLVLLQPQQRRRCRVSQQADAGAVRRTTLRAAAGAIMQPALGDGGPLLYQLCGRWEEVSKSQPRQAEGRARRAAATPRRSPLGLLPKRADSPATRFPSSPKRGERSAVTSTACSPLLVGG